MNIALQITANLTIVFAPFLPAKAKAVREFLNLAELDWSHAGRPDILSADHALHNEKPRLLIHKIEDSLVEKEVQKLEESKTQAAPANHEPQKEVIDFQDFMKMDIRVGHILEAEKVPKADKLLKLLVDTGLDKRTVVSGIAEHFSPEEIIGKKVSVLLNLAPRKIRGVESQGMILMAENESGKLDFVSPDQQFEAGSEIR